MPPTSALIDFDHNQIDTPVGRFRIFKVDETNIAFDDPQSPFKVFGNLDRQTGSMTVFWRTPEEEAKLQAGLPWKMSKYSELTCTVLKRVF